LEELIDSGKFKSKKTWGHMEPWYP